MSKMRDRIKAIQDTKSERVTMPEWENLEIEIRTMKAIDRAKLLKMAVDAEGKVIGDKFQAGMIIASCFDPETGEKIFANDDADMIMEKSAGVIEFLAGRAMELSGLSRETMKTAEKNS